MYETNTVGQISNILKEIKAQVKSWKALWWGCFIKGLEGDHWLTLTTRSVDFMTPYEHVGPSVTQTLSEHHKNLNNNWKCAFRQWGPAEAPLWPQQGLRPKFEQNHLQAAVCLSCVTCCSECRRSSLKLRPPSAQDDEWSSFMWN